MCGLVGLVVPYNTSYNTTGGLCLVSRVSCLVYRGEEGASSGDVTRRVVQYCIVGRVLCGGRLECVDMIAMALGEVLVLVGAGLHGAG